MHQGRPYGLHVIGGKLTDRDEAFVSVTARRFSNLKDIALTDSSRMVYDLPDGGYVVIQDMGGNFRVIAHKPVKRDLYITDGMAYNYIPMLFSGAMGEGGMLAEGKGLPMTLTLTTRKRIFNYNGIYAPRNVKLVRFSCPYAPMFNEFLPLQPIHGVIYTQYGQQRPTWYSGAMAELIQIVGGYGRQDLGNLPDDSIERSNIKIPIKYQERIDTYINNRRLPAYSGLPHRAGQFQCDYKHSNTDLVGFDSNNNPWLIKVNGAGVWAMPLPIIPATNAPAFRDYMESVGDDEVLQILDRFGAMPSGESFPVGGAFHAWHRAGVVIKVCDTSDFYQHSGYSSAMGWSINSRGDEAINTCYDIDDSNGVFYSMAYRLRLQLGVTSNLGWAASTTSGDFNDINDRNKVTSYLNKLYELIDERSQVGNAIKYKISRATGKELLLRSASKVTDTEVDYWDNLILAPIANHSGSVTMISRGNVYRGVHIKVPEPYSKGCISLNFLPKNDAYARPKSDVIVFAYYIGDDLKTVNYFDDDRPLKALVTDNYQEDMIVGEWSRYSYSDSGAIAGSLYTSDTDYRKALAPSIGTTLIKGQDMGYGLPAFYFPEYFQMSGVFMRWRYYSTETTTENIGGAYIKDGVLMPYFFRNASIFACTEGSNTKTTNWSIKSGSVQDPTSYAIWTYHPVWARSGGLSVMKGRPYPEYGRPVYAEILQHNPNIQGGSFADSGAWLSGLPYDITEMMYGYTADVVWADQGIPPQPSIVPKSTRTTVYGDSKQVLVANIMQRADIVKVTTHSDSYYTSSPDFFGGIFYRDACKVVFGSIDYANISEETETGNRKQWGESTLVDNKSAHHFIGVINE